MASPLGIQHYRAVGTLSDLFRSVRRAGARWAPGRFASTGGSERSDRRSSVRWRRWFTAAAALALASLLTSCTAIGFGLGFALDRSQRDETRTAVAKVLRGGLITLHMRDGSEIRGWFRTLIEPDTASYAAIHNDWALATDSAALIPVPGERVKLSGGLSAMEGAFRGLSPAGVRLKRDGAGSSHVVRFGEFKKLTDASNRTFTSHSLEGLLQTRSVPTGTLVEFQRQVQSSSLAEFDEFGRRERVAWDDVVSVDAPTSYHWRLILTTIGVGLDIWVIFLWGSIGS